MEVNLPLIKIKSIERPYRRYFYHFLALHPRSPHHYGDISVLFKRPWPTLERPSNDGIGAKSVEIRAVLGEKNIFIRPFVPFHRAIFPNLFFSRVGCWTNVSYRGWKESNPIQLCEYYFFAKFYVGRRAFKKERKKRKEEREKKRVHANFSKKICSFFDSTRLSLTRCIVNRVERGSKEKFIKMDVGRSTLARREGKKKEFKEFQSCCWIVYKFRVVEKFAPKIF